MSEKTSLANFSTDLRSSLLFGDDPSVLLPSKSSPENQIDRSGPGSIAHGPVIAKSRHADENDILYKWRMQRKLDGVRSGGGESVNGGSNYHTPRTSRAGDGEMHGRQVKTGTEQIGSFHMETAIEGSREMLES